MNQLCLLVYCIPIHSHIRGSEFSLSPEINLKKTNLNISRHINIITTDSLTHLQHVQDKTRQGQKTHKDITGQNKLI